MNEIYIIKIWTGGKNARLIKIKYIVTKDFKELKQYVSSLIHKIKLTKKIIKTTMEVTRMIDYKEKEIILSNDDFKLPEMILTMTDYRCEERSGKNWKCYINNAYMKWVKSQDKRNKYYIERMT